MSAGSTPRAFSARQRSRRRCEDLAGPGCRRPRCNRPRHQQGVGLGIGHRRPGEQGTRQQQRLQAFQAIPPRAAEPPPQETVKSHKDCGARRKKKIISRQRKRARQAILRARSRKLALRPGLEPGSIPIKQSFSAHNTGSQIETSDCQFLRILLGFLQTVFACVSNTGKQYKTREFVTPVLPERQFDFRRGDPMPKRILTATAIAKLKPDPSKRLEIPDAACTGLYLILQPSGARSWGVTAPSRRPAAKS